MVKLGIILGSGLNNFGNELQEEKLIFEDSVSFHKLKILEGKIENNSVIIFQGRRHLYEGYKMDDVYINVNKAKELGVTNLIITNAAGGLNKNFCVSDLMLISSHFNFSFKLFPKIGVNKFYDSSVYNKISQLALDEKINLRIGSYCCFLGPTYETKSEIKFLKKIKADAVGMSTVPEVLFASSLGIKVVGISCITNIASETNFSLTTHDEVVEAGERAYRNFSSLLKSIIKNSNKIFN